VTLPFSKYMTTQGLRDVVAKNRVVTRCTDSGGSESGVVWMEVFVDPARFEAPERAKQVTGGATWSPAMLSSARPKLSFVLPLVLSATFVSAQPSEVVREQITLRGSVDSVDHTNRTVAIRGDRGNVVTVDVPTRTEAAAVQAIPTVEELRNRLTISVLWGWDNQFSGKMIESATGQTTTGLPIVMDETSFDEVYGRMGAFKLGVGYRMSPRSEAVLNFVYSESGSETANVGTVGAANVPLYVDFDDYSYWGFEGGQRFFFARPRFTPFAGYLVGINRFGDIRGNFVDVPLSMTPGLAAQDGKFFEASWALSLGPTAGVLVGFGPVEFMLETQLRFMGGLSDVDWLVEEGLRDINSESSRWSIPIQLGARIRFP
jgi:hypothetical protein